MYVHWFSDAFKRNGTIILMVSLDEGKWEGGEGGEFTGLFLQLNISTSPHLDFVL